MPGPASRPPRGFVGIVSAELRFGEAGSLKDKRMHLRRVRDRLTKRHGATFAEIGYQDLWRRAVVVFAVASSDVHELEKRVAAAMAFLDSQEWELAWVHEEVVEIDE
ncbi:MAG: DUF503 domain-containing protein [Thermoleophilia bacterium]